MAGTFAGLAEDAKKLPVWAWPILGGGVFLVYRHFQGRGTTAPTPATTTTDPGATGGAGAPDPGINGGGGSSSGGSSSGGSSSGGGGNGGRHAKDPLPYTVRAGDTLSSIAARYHEDSQGLFSRNQQRLDAAAQQHGLADSAGGNWIFPGTVIYI